MVLREKDSLTQLLFFGVSTTKTVYLFYADSDLNTFKCCLYLYYLVLIHVLLKIQNKTMQCKFLLLQLLYTNVL